MNRRQVLALLTTASALPLLNACSGQTVAQVAVTTIQDIANVSAAFTAGLQVMTVAGVQLPAKLNVTAIMGYVTQFSQIAQSFVPGISATAALPLAQQLLPLLNDILAAGAMLAPPPFSTAFAIAQVLIPLAVNTIAQLLGKPLPASAARAASPSMTPEQARDQLNRLLQSLRARG